MTSWNLSNGLSMKAGTEANNQQLRGSTTGLKRMIVAWEEDQQERQEGPSRSSESQVGRTSG